MNGGSEDRTGFSWKLLYQVLAAWGGSGLFSSMAVTSDGCGGPVLLGICTASLGLAVAAGLAAFGPDDRWYLLRWVNGFLNAAFVVAPAVTGVGMRFVMAAAGGMQKVDDPLNPRQAFVVQSAVLVGIIVGAAVRLAMMWGRVRHADLPTGTEK